MKSISIGGFFFSSAVCPKVPPALLMLSLYPVLEPALLVGVVMAPHWGGRRQGWELCAAQLSVPLHLLHGFYILLWHWVEAKGNPMMISWWKKRELKCWILVWCFLNNFILCFLGHCFYFWFYFQPYWEAGGIFELHGQNPEGSGILPGQQSWQPGAEPCGRSWVWSLAWMR